MWLFNHTLCLHFNAFVSPALLWNLFIFSRYESWDDPDVPKFHYGSHYSSAGIVLFYLIRLPPFSMENQKLQGGQFDHADRLFNNIRDTWLSASGKSNTSDVKELIPEFFYLPEFLENRFNLDLGIKQSGEKVCDVFQLSAISLNKSDYQSSRALVLSVSFFSWEGLSVPVSFILIHV